MTFLDHIKHLAVGLTPKEKQELADYLSGSDELYAEKPKSLRGDWGSTVLSTDPDIDADLKEIRSEWQREWREDEFVG